MAVDRDPRTLGTLVSLSSDLASLVSARCFMRDGFVDGAGHARPLDPRSPPALEINSTAGRFAPFNNSVRLLRRVPAHVIDGHGPGTGQAADGSTQGTADRFIQDEEHRLIEWPHIP